MSTKKEDFKKLLNKMSEKKELEIPIQKVVPAEAHSDVEKKTPLNENVKISLNIYVEDWMDLTRFKNYKILKDRNLEFTMSDVIMYGFELLNEKYNIVRNKEKISLKRGRRNKERIDVKTTSIDLPEERVQFINDFLYFKVFELQQLDYTRPEMFNEMVKLIKSSNQKIFK